MSEPTEQEIQDAEAGFLIDIIMRMMAGRNPRVVVSTLNSALYNIANQLNPQGKEFIAQNMIACVNDINALIVPPEYAEQSAETNPTVQ